MEELCVKPCYNVICLILILCLFWNITAVPAFAAQIEEAPTQTAETQEDAGNSAENHMDAAFSGEQGTEIEKDSMTTAAAFQAEMPQYFQTDYPNDRYGYGTVATSGCGITCVAMVATYLTGHEYLPDELADYFGGYGENNIQKLEYASDMLQLPWERAENFHAALQALREGKVVIALMNQNSIFTDSQHFIVLKGLTEDGRILVNDPYEPNYDYWLLKNGFANGFAEGDILCGYSGAWIYDKNAMPEEAFIYVEEKPYVECRYPGLELTWEEQQLLAKVIWVEARGESAEGQQAIAEIVYNRMTSTDFPNTLQSVIYAEGQFRSVPFLDEATPSQAQYEALENALSGPYVLPADVVHFATYPVNDNVWGQIGGHIFCYGDAKTE
ncbi:MAG: cell wall hydrolase [Faecousia sp.]